MENLKLIALIALIGIPVISVYALAGNAAWCVLLPILAGLLVLAVRAGKDYERTRKQALREVEEARKWGGA